MANLTPQEINEILDEYFSETYQRTYIGKRYVPIFGRKGESTMEWDNDAPYEPLTIVLYEGNSYTSRQYVPIGAEITDTDFWVLTGNYNAQVESYRQEVETYTQAYGDAINALEDALPITSFSSSDTVADELGSLDSRIDDIEDFIPETVIGFDTVAEMKASTILENGMICHTNGFYELNDKGGAFYKIVSNETANEMDIIACGNLYAVLIIDSPQLSAEKFGCKAESDFDNTDIINFIFGKYIDNCIIFTNGEYEISNTISITPHINMINSKFVVTDEISTAIILNNVSDNRTKYINSDFNINLDCNNLASTGIDNKYTRRIRGNIWVSNIKDIGVNLDTYGGGNNESLFNIYCDCESGSNGERIGVYCHQGYDNNLGELVCVNCKIGIYLIDDGVKINELHAWCENDADFIGSTCIRIENGFCEVTKLYQDNMNYAVYSSSKNITTRTFNKISIVNYQWLQSLTGANTTVLKFDSDYTAIFTNVVILDSIRKTLPVFVEDYSTYRNNFYMSYESNPAESYSLSAGSVNDIDTLPNTGRFWVLANTANLPSALASQNNQIFCEGMGTNSLQRMYQLGSGGKLVAEYIRYKQWSGWTNWTSVTFA